MQLGIEAREHQRHQSAYPAPITPTCPPPRLAAPESDEGGSQTKAEIA